MAHAERIKTLFDEALEKVEGESPGDQLGRIVGSIRESVLELAEAVDRLEQVTGPDVR